MSLSAAIPQADSRYHSEATAQTVDSFWYSKSTATTFVFILLMIVLAISYVIAPMQSPDEPEHLKRAYLLSKGEIFPTTENGLSGGEIDTGLLSYMESFDDIRFQYDHKAKASTLRSDSRIGWSHRREFRGFPNTAFYFPIPYLPQALGFLIGERSGLTVQESYYLARACSLAATLGLLLAALLLYPAPPPVLALLLMPMSLFQFGSASLDSVTYALATLTGALFMRGASRSYSFSTGMHVAMVLCIFLLAASRIALIALTPLPLILLKVRRRPAYLLSFAVVFCLTSAWLLYGLMAIKGASVRSLTTLEILHYYLLHPLAVLRIFFDTLTDTDILGGYWRMFVGVLGWLDTPLASGIYSLFAVLLAALTALALVGRGRYWNGLGSLSLSGAALLSILLMFFAFLITYESFPTRTFEYIQGRYFIPPVILLAYAIPARRLSPAEIKLVGALLSVTVTLTVADVVPRLVQRYWAT